MCSFSKSDAAASSCMQKKYLIPLGLVVIVGAILVTFFTRRPVSPQSSDAPALTGSVQVVIDFGTGYPHNATVPYQPTATAFSALEAAVVGTNLPVRADHSSDLGVFVREIGGMKNGDNKKYWQYWVNGAFPLIASDKYYLVPNDLVEWKFAEEQPMK